MSEVGILYTAQMIRAYVADLKTQTRRTAGLKEINEEPDRWELIDLDGAVAQFRRDDGVERVVKSRYGVPGKTSLWTREAWRLSGWDWEDAWQTIAYAADDSKKNCELPEWDEGGEKWTEWMIAEVDRFAALPGAKWINRHTKEVDAAPDDESMLDLTACQVPWRPGIHQPRWAARIVKPLLTLRFERVQSISHDDAIAEGIDRAGLDSDVSAVRHQLVNGSLAVDRYARLWDSINGDGDFAKNKWVQVLSFPKRSDL